MHLHLYSAFCSHAFIASSPKFLEFRIPSLSQLQVSFSMAFSNDRPSPANAACARISMQSSTGAWTKHELPRESRSQTQVNCKTKSDFFFFNGWK